MEGLNRVMLLGNLGADPELRMTSGGSAVLKARLATSETYLDKSKERQERTEWHNVVVWGKRAEALGKILRKGDRIYVEGGLRTSSYDDRDGVKRYRTEVVASDVLLQGSSSKGSSRSSPSRAQPDDDGAPSFPDPDPSNMAGFDGDDDIPF